MMCPLCSAKDPQPEHFEKAKVVKTQNHGQTTHRIYRCTNQDCRETFHTIEIPRERHSYLETLEQSVRDLLNL